MGICFSQCTNTEQNEMINIPLSTSRKIYDDVEYCK